jgi:hypothetical protein
LVLIKSGDDQFTYYLQTRSEKMMLRKLLGFGLQRGLLAQVRGAPRTFIPPAVVQKPKTEKKEVAKTSNAPAKVEKASKELKPVKEGEEVVKKPKARRHVVGNFSSSPEFFRKYEMIGKFMRVGRCPFDRQEEPGEQRSLD